MMNTPLNIMIEFSSHTVEKVLHYPEENTVVIPFEGVKEPITIKKIILNILKRKGVKILLNYPRNYFNHYNKLTKQYCLHVINDNKLSWAIFNNSLQQFLAIQSRIGTQNGR